MKVVKLSDTAILPTKNYPTDAGYDLYADESYHVYPGSPTKISTNIAVQIPVGHVGIIKDRSSTGSKGLQVLAGVIDSSYTGHIIVCVHYIHGNQVNKYIINKGDRIAQLVVVPIYSSPVEEVDSLQTTERGDNGFGSSGV